MPFSTYRPHLRAEAVPASFIRPVIIALTALLLAAAAQTARAADGEDARAQSQAQESSEMSADQAWKDAKQDWRAMQNASGEAWEDAKDEFEDSWARLETALQESGEAAPPPSPSLEAKSPDTD